MAKPKYRPYVDCRETVNRKFQSHRLKRAKCASFECDTSHADISRRGEFGSVHCREDACYERRLATQTT